MRKLLFVEDDLNLSSIVKENLEDLNFEVIHVVSGSEAVHYLQNHSVDVVLMDVELVGDMDGFQAAEEIRSAHPVLPVVFATARQSGNDLERGFKIQYMDYVRKPYRMKEIALRIEGLIGSERKKEDERTIGHTTFDPVVRTLQVNNKEIHLSNLESELLVLLSNTPGKVVCKDYIIEQLWSGTDDPKSKEASLHNLVYSLRKYFKEDPALSLEVVSKQGYRILTAQE